VAACLERQGVRYAFAGYWVAYKVTFLTGERVIVAPRDGLDRYSPYTTAVSARHDAPVIDDVSASIERFPACGEVVERVR
jgi:hypothetical protein